MTAPIVLPTNPRVVRLFRSLTLTVERIGAACLQHPEAWFDKSSSADGRQAVKLCGTCDASELCRAYALAAEEPFGIWGGLSESRRQKILSERRRGRGRALR